MRFRAVVIRGKRQRHHGRAKIRTANANIHDICDIAFTNIGGKARHGFQHIMHIMHNVVAIHKNHFRFRAAQSGVQHSAFFSCVDHIAAHHVITCRFNLGRL